MAFESTDSAQLIPEILKDPSVQVVNFCRTPQWYIPRVRYLFHRKHTEINNVQFI